MYYCYVVHMYQISILSQSISWTFSFNLEPFMFDIAFILCLYTQRNTIYCLFRKKANK